MPVNEYVKSHEFIFIQYHDIIKSYKPYLLKKLLYNKDYREGYTGALNFDLFKDYSDNQLLGLAMRSLSKNILEYISISEFDYDATLESLYEDTEDFPDMFSESPLLKIGTTIFSLLKLDYVKKIYVHTNTYDERIHKDLIDTYGDMKRITYVNGDFIDAVKAIPEKITTYIVNDVRTIDTLIENDLISYSNVLVADAGWNYKQNEENKIVLKCDDIEAKSKKHIFKTGTFVVDSDIIYST